MPISEVLKNMRGSSYGKKEETPEPEGERVLELTPEEMKALGAASEQPIVVQVMGRVGEGCIYVDGVKGPGGEQDVNADAEQVISKYRQAPMVQTQTVPSPS